MDGPGRTQKTEPESIYGDFQAMNISKQEQNIEEQVNRKSKISSKETFFVVKKTREMEKGKAVMGVGRRWAVDFSDYSSSPSSRDFPDPPGFSRSSLDQVLFLSSLYNFGIFFLFFLTNFG